MSMSAPYAYQVTDGGFLDIDMTIKEKDGEILAEELRSSESSAVISAPSDGRISICFGNKMSSMTSKDIMFSISGGKTQQIDTGTKEEQDEETKQMGEQIQDLFTKMLTVKDENQYMSSRELQHSQINEATHANVLYWAIFQCLVVIFMSIGQVYYMKRFFEQKRMV
ncbi:hypothetical protein SARC_12875 [Sphaeroforma arctica JP610]|uniref:GOLD domain-containing protein n=1 Tax=Sphaeroforma arctica JP610 TaxID=667725 RepID=A0A0L0FEW8_9EUKA|nr:hypothetical protein SARC_12875 [Sphaeroforma arctica JP610]KNC74583.1 hypothetical protein SARC_12875 [Sphaeroforma arctica JP610]|eukprot:XP_014148485.1 hypothetical protein SARC_12875 [Sphaeroforma arctica JP610]